MKIHAEVFIAAQILGKNQAWFSTGDLISFIRSEFKDYRNGVITHVGSACVANAPLNHASGYNYLWRLDYGKLRVFQPGVDIPKPERKNDRTRPEVEDIPEKYRFLLRTH